MIKKDEDGKTYLSFPTNEIKELSEEAYKEILEYEERDAPPEIVEHDKDD